MIWLDVSRTKGRRQLNLTQIVICSKALISTLLIADLAKMVHDSLVRCKLHIINN